MASPEDQALADLTQAVTDVGTAIATEIVALQAAMNAQGVNNTPAIEASVTKIRALIGNLNASLVPPVVVPAVPAVTSIAPASGPVAGGTSVVITGSGFKGATGVSFSSIAAASFVVNSDTQITAVTPVGATGANLPVIVTTPGGVSAVNTLWTYGAAGAAGGPVVSSISPTSGPVAGGTSVILTGTGLTGATRVTVGGNAATGLSVSSDTSMTFTAPAGAAGAAPVVVTTPAGVSGAATAFTYA
jgi:IPT/TIG domain